MSRLFTIDALAPGSIEFASPDLAFDYACVRAGDMDADGHDEVLVCALQGSGSEAQRLGFLIYGQPLARGRIDPMDGSIRKATIKLPPSGEVQAAGGADVNGDGFDDLAIDLRGFTAVVFGSPALPDFDISDLGNTVPGVNVLPAPGLTLERVMLGKDINGDGLGEILVGDDFFGANTDDWGKGRAYVIFGSTRFPESISLEDVGGTVPGFIVTGTRPNVRFEGIPGDGIGACVESLGDVDTDGFNDLGIAGNSCLRGSYILFGRPEFPPVITVDEIPGVFGVYLPGTSGCMKAMGDFNGDGFGDFTLQYGGEPRNFDVTAPLRDHYDVLIVGGRPRREFPPEILPRFFIEEDLRTTVLRGSSPFCPAQRPIDGGIDVDRGGTSDVLFENIWYTLFAPEETYSQNNGFLCFFPTRRGLPRVVEMRDIATRYGYFIGGRPNDRLGEVQIRMNLLSDFDGDGSGEILVGAGRGKGTSSAFIIPYRELVDPPRLELAGASPAVGAVDGGDVIMLVGEGLYPGTEFFIGGTRAEVVGGRTAKDARVAVPAWRGGSLAVDIEAWRGGRSAVLPNGFLYFRGPVVDVRDLAAGNVRGSELYTNLRYLNRNGEPFDPSIERAEMAQDVNGDGTDDLLLFWSAGKDSNDPRRQGGVFRQTTSLIYGGSHLNRPFDYSFPAADHGITMPYFNVLEEMDFVDEPRIWELRGAGDIDGDRYGDLSCVTVSRENTSSLYLLFGGRSLPTQTHPQDFPRKIRIRNRLAHAFKFVDDLDGGGYRDLVHGRWEESSEYPQGIFFIRGEDLLLQPEEIEWSSLPKLEIAWRAPGVNSGGIWDLDWNGDGQSDIAISCADGPWDGLLIVYGGRSYLTLPSPVIVDDAFLKGDGEERGVLLARSELARDQFANHVLSNVGDLDGDGADELLAGNPWVSAEVEGKTVPLGGEAYVIGSNALAAGPDSSGRAQAWAAQFGVTPYALYDPESPRKGILTFQSPYAYESLGTAVSGAGDLNGDGIPDLAIGTHYYLPAEEPIGLPAAQWGLPYTYIVFGNRSLLAGENRVLRRENFESGILLRGAGNLVTGGRDVNSDGYPDVLAVRNWSRAWLLFGGPELAAFRFRRGDVNLDGVLDISDPIALLGYLFLGSERPRCLDAADADDSGTVDISDAIVILEFLFQFGDRPKPPFLDPGRDPTPDALECF